MSLHEQVERLLEERVRPYLHSHGGEVQLLGCEDGVVSVRLTGSCAGCPAADLSTRQFLEETLRAELPEVQRVEVDRAVDEELLAQARRILSGGGRV